MLTKYCLVQTKVCAKFRLRLPTFATFFRPAPKNLDEQWMSAIAANFNLYYSGLKRKFATVWRNFRSSFALLFDSTVFTLIRKVSYVCEINVQYLEDTSATRRTKYSFKSLTMVGLVKFKPSFCASALQAGDLVQAP